MCDDGPIVFDKNIRCSICRKSPAARLFEYAYDETFCRSCLLDTFGKEIVAELEFESDQCEVRE